MVNVEKCIRTLWVTDARHGPNMLTISRPPQMSPDPPNFAFNEMEGSMFENAISGTLSYF